MNSGLLTLFFINCHKYMQLVLVKGVLLLRHSSKSSILIQQSKDLVMTSCAIPQQLQYEVKMPQLPSQFSNNMLRINVNITGELRAVLGLSACPVQLHYEDTS